MGEWDKKRVGYRLSPHFLYHGMSDSDPRKTFSRCAEELNRIGIGYIHLIEPVGGKLGLPEPDTQIVPLIRAKFNGTLILNGGYDAASGNAATDRGLADLVSYGVLFLANPDLPERFRTGSALNNADISTLYSGEEKGYTDYPSL
jgi:N-ethylmaleimide reductase